MFVYRRELNELGWHGAILDLKGASTIYFSLIAIWRAFPVENAR